MTGTSSAGALRLRVDPSRLVSLRHGGGDPQPGVRCRSTWAWQGSFAKFAASVRKGDRVIVTADDMIADAWTNTDTGEARAKITLRAREIAASMAFDTLRTGYAARKAARVAAANGQPNDLPAQEHTLARHLNPRPGRDPGDPAVVAVDTVTSDLILTDPAQVTPYNQLYARLVRRCPAPAGSLDLLTHAATTLPDD